jgi:hypothetical protein
MLHASNFLPSDREVGAGNNTLCLPDKQWSESIRSAQIQHKH